MTGAGGCWQPPSMVEVQSLPCPRGDPLPTGKTEEAGPWLEKRLGGGVRGLSLEMLREKCTNDKGTWPPRSRNTTLPRALRGDHCPDFLDRASCCLLSDFTYTVYTVVVSSHCRTGFRIQCRSTIRLPCAAVCELVRGRHGDGVRSHRCAPSSVQRLLALNSRFKTCSVMTDRLTGSISALR